MSINVDTIRGVAIIQTLEKFKCELAKFKTNSVSSQPGYISAYLEKYGDLEKSILLSVNYQGVIVGYLCIQEIYKDYFVAISPLSDYTDIAIKKGMDEVVLKAFTDYIITNNCSIEFSRTSLWCSNAFRLSIRSGGIEGIWGKVNQNPIVANICGFDLYLLSKSRRRRESIRRKIRKLNDNYLIQGISEQELSLCSELFFKWHSQRHVLSKYSTPKRQFFFKEKLRNLFPKKMFGMKISRDNTIVGVFWYFVHNNELQYLNGSWEPNLRKDGIGSICHSFMIKKAMDEGYNYNFMFGAEDYKLSFCNAINISRRVVIKKALSSYGNGIKINKKKVCLFVAHPDDELVFFQGLLNFFSGQNVSIDVISLTWFFGDKLYTETRQKEFQQSGHRNGFNPLNMGNEDCLGYHHQKNFVKNVRQFKHIAHKYAKIYTHGLFGEYGHPHHIEASLIAGLSFPEKTLYLFPKLQNCKQKRSFQNRDNLKQNILDCYASQRGIENLFLRKESYCEIEPAVLFSLLKAIFNSEAESICEQLGLRGANLSYGNSILNKMLKEYKQVHYKKFTAKIINRFWNPFEKRINRM